MKPAFVLVRNGTIESESLSHKELLLRHPSAVYTSARTLHKRYVFDLPGHLARLPLGSHEQFLRSARLAVKEFERRYPEVPELKLTFVFDPHHGDAFTHVSSLLAPAAATCAVEVRQHAPRANALVKATNWVAERESLERHIKGDVNEVILQDHDGKLYEGLSSNFFVSRVHAKTGESYLQTAPAGTVLEGTVQKLMVTACKELRIPVLYENPLSQEALEWTGVCVSSTSRLVLPAHSVRFPEAPRRAPVAAMDFPKLLDGAQSHISVPPTSPRKESDIIGRIRDYVATHVQDHSADLFA